MSEKEMLIEGLPLGADSEVFRRWEQQVLGWTPACPTPEQIIAVVRGVGMTPKEIDAVLDHSLTCRYCGGMMNGFTHPPQVDARLEWLRKHLAGDAS